MIASLNEHKKVIHHKNEVIARVQKTGGSHNQLRVIQETWTTPNGLQVTCKCRNIMDYECGNSFRSKVNPVALLAISVSFSR
jgi:hypothetical protein